MPELPEVEAARRLIKRGCIGKKILKAVVADDNTEMPLVEVFEGASSDEVRSALEGHRILAAQRKGKYLWLELDNAEGPWPLLHFGMTGGIVVKGLGVTKYKRIHLESDPDMWPPKFTKLELELEGGGQVAFVDARRFGRVKLQKDPPSQEPLSRMGFDVLDELPSADAFTAAVRQRVARATALKIKALLLDQEFCCGIGNWVGDEVLYQARIHPEQPVSSLDPAALAALHAAIRYVVDTAVAAEADSERFPRDWLFHYRWTNKKPGFVNGHALDFVKVGSRTSAFVPALQKLTENAGGSSGKASGSSRKRGKQVKSEDEENDDDDESEEEEEEEEDQKKKKRKPAGARKAQAESARGKSASASKAAKQRGGKKAKRKAAGSDSEEDTEKEQDLESEEQQEEEEQDVGDSEDDDTNGKKRSPGKPTARQAAAAAKRAAAAASRKKAA